MKGKDATRAFHSVNHSPHAYELLEQFAGERGASSTTKTNSTSLAVTLSQVRRKLFSKEDPFGLHKSLGLFCLLHFIYRIDQMLFSDPSAGLGSRLGRGPSWIPPACLLPHAALSLSSLIFRHVPRERVVGNPM
jgi:hypothetical protein